MGEPLIFLICWLLFCACGGLAIMNFDRLTVMALDAIDAPGFDAARMVAALIYRHPEQWESGSSTMAYQQLGVGIHFYSAASVRITGPFGDWQPNLIERRIIWNAIIWRQRAQIQSLVRKQLS